MILHLPHKLWGKKRMKIMFDEAVCVELILKGNYLDFCL